MRRGQGCVSWLRILDSEYPLHQFYSQCYRGKGIWDGFTWNKELDKYYESVRNFNCPIVKKKYLRELEQDANEKDVQILFVRPHKIETIGVNNATQKSSQGRNEETEAESNQ